MSLSRTALFALALGALPAQAQDVAVASLPFLGGLTAGPTATDYMPPNDAKDLWVIEDLGLDTGAVLSRFESRGNIYPDPPVVHGVSVRIYRGFPPEGGELVLESTPGEGGFEKKGLDEVYVTDFGGQFLPAGEYWVAWSVATATDQGKVSIVWAQGGAHKVGGGLPDNAFLWNPGGAWGFENNYKKVPEDLEGNGQTGVNFTLFGKPQEACYPDFDASGTLNLFDFLAFVNSFNADDPDADCDGNGSRDLFDFLCFTNAFNEGC